MCVRSEGRGTQAWRTVDVVEDLLDDLHELRWGVGAKQGRVGRKQTTPVSTTHSFLQQHFPSGTPANAGLTVATALRTPDTENIEQNILPAVVAPPMHTHRVPLELAPLAQELNVLELLKVELALAGDAVHLKLELRRLWRGERWGVRCLRVQLDVWW